MRRASAADAHGRGRTASLERLRQSMRTVRLSSTMSTGSFMLAPRREPSRDARERQADVERSSVAGGAERIAARAACR